MVEASVVSGGHVLWDDHLIQAVSQWQFLARDVDSADEEAEAGPSYVRSLIVELRLKEGEAERDLVTFEPPNKITILGEIELVGPSG